MQIHLVRHGYHLDGFRGGWSPFGLAPQGRAQARVLAARFRREGWQVDTLLTSDLARASETADLLAEAVGTAPQPAPEWRETNNGVLAGVSNVEAEERFPGLYWDRLAMDEAYPGGESPNAFYQRISCAFRQLCADVEAGRLGPRVMVVTHGGVIKAVAATVAGVEWSNRLKGFRCANTGIYTFELQNGSWVCVREDDHDHLDDALRDEVELVDSDSRWPLVFEDERRRIAKALGVDAVEHIGSTAIPGVPAKPVIDILVGMESLELSAEQVARLERLGYEARGERSGVEGRLFFRKGNPRTHHIHVVQRGGQLWVDYLLFRDYMRANPDEAARYGALKRELAGAFKDQRPRYTEGKTPFVSGILEKARASATRS